MEDMGMKSVFEELSVDQFNNDINIQMDLQDLLSYGVSTQVWGGVARETLHSLQQALENNLRVELHQLLTDSYKRKWGKLFQ
jgi:hypothetical protein